MIVTKSENNIIYEINGKPALDVIFDYSTIDESSNWGVVSINMCLAIKSPQEFRDQYDEYLIRFMVTCDTEKRSIGMSANIQEGTEVWIARRSLDKIDEGVISLATSVKNNLKNRRPLYIFHFDCGGRGRVIMDEDHKMRNLRFMQREVGESIPWSGFYTYGEIAPVANENCFHSYTAVLFYLYE